MSARFWNCRGGSNDSVLWTPVYGGNKGLWYRAVVRPLHRLGRRASVAKWAVYHRFHPRHRYNIVRTGLTPGYYDEDTLILYACFAMLESYIKCHGGDAALERWTKELAETPDKNSPPGLQEAQAGRQSEALALYRWWKIEKPADEKRRDELLMAVYGNKKLETKPTAHPDLVEMVPFKFSAQEEDLNKQFRALERKIEEDEQTMLHRLIDIRRSLWT